MADYNINSGNLTSLGTTAADNFYFRTGGAPNVVINALAGNDSVWVEASQGALESGNVGPFDGLYAALQGGADYLYASAQTGGVNSATTIRAGAGGDTLLFKAGDGAAAEWTALQVMLGDGSDAMNMAFTALNNSEIQGGAGADTVILSGREINTSEVLLGSGADNLTVSAQSADASYFELGGGADIGNFDIGAISAVTIGAGAGDDLVALSAATITSSLLDAGGGLDTVNVSAGTGTITVLGGEGNDALNFLGDKVDLLTASVIRGDAGNDSIYFSGGQYDTGVSVWGGVGADTINISNINNNGSNTENALYLKYAAPADSNLSTFDYINASAGQTAVIQTPNLSLQAVSNGQYAGFSIQNGVALFTSGSPTLAQAVDMLDDVLNVGQAVAFSAQGTDGQGGNLNNNTYIFIQGGNLQNSPVLDDYVIMTDQVNKTTVDTTTNTLNVQYS